MCVQTEFTINSTLRCRAPTSVASHQRFGFAIRPSHSRVITVRIVCESIIVEQNSYLQKLIDNCILIVWCILADTL